MIDNRRLGAAILLGLMLGACAGPAIPRATPPRAAPPPPSTVVRPVQNNALIGNSADAIGRMFGKPRLDVTEGAGRKLQYAGSTCILDVYFYAPRAGADPVATHVDARTPDGRNAEVDSCARALRR
ncbi:conserved exported protein of unknown function [uncultured Sphingopyxis sp.]|uniref:Secreted protein n=1 Tax=uncultured Sphingopyxis sp. TaxID=310581 RepID=A0A1Y5PXH9_9SPHN|nr:hypothetical protein [uncultured Sphingopyxis sp.]SBV34723.1 conserved exported protein of unknown function [uncultured Sphingopyxis sp.]